MRFAEWATLNNHFSRNGLYLRRVAVPVGTIYEDFDYFVYYTLQVQPLQYTSTQLYALPLPRTGRLVPKKEWDGRADRNRHCPLPLSGFAIASVTNTMNRSVAIR